MHLHPRALAATSVAAALLLGGCAGGKEDALPPPAPPTRAVPSVLPSTTTPTPTATPTPADPSATPPLRETKPVKVTAVQATTRGDRLEVSGRIVDEAGEPIVGAVGDFYVEGAGRNLVTGYATKMDGSFSATFTTAEVPAEATLMLHFRGDDQHSSGSFLIRRGTPKPAPTTPRPTTAAPAPTATPPRLVGPDGRGTPRSERNGTEVVVTGRVLDGAGKPVANSQLRLKVGTQELSATSGADGGFRIGVQPGADREGQLSVAGTAPTRITW